MDDKRVADYFVVAGYPDHDQSAEILDEFSREGGANMKATYNQAPIVDVAVIIRSMDEHPPIGFELVEFTPSGMPADLNHGSLRCPSVYLCFKRGRDKPPLVDIGCLYELKEQLMADSEVVKTTPYGRPANVNNTSSRTFITFRRASESAPCNDLVVTDVCVIIANKGETPPHAFCKIDKNLNRGLVGSDVFLCYKKRMNRANYIPYKPAILNRYPLEDHSTVLPDSVPLFCLPMGATIECWPEKAQFPAPIFSTFVLTVSHASAKMYGAAVTFYERFPSQRLMADQKEFLRLDDQESNKRMTVVTAKAICILSHWPFFSAFEKFLFFIYRLSFSGEEHSLPIERYISHFMLNVPFPSPQRPKILIQLTGSDTISLARPQHTPLPLSGASFSKMLINLGPDNCMTLLLFALTEQKILIHSLRPDVLTFVAEAVTSMLFPFRWQCPYIPLCPLGLSDYLSAPMPFIVGVDSRYFDLYDPPQDVSCIDLDTNSITISDDRKAVNIKLLPKKPARQLRHTLEILFDKMYDLTMTRHHLEKSSKRHSNPDSEKTSGIKKMENAIELEIQEAFLRFMATILKGLRTYLLPITRAPSAGATDLNALFDVQGFVRSRDKTHHRFFSMLMKTQMFTRFIEERSFVSTDDDSLAFFDECIDKIEQAELDEDENFKLIESDNIVNSDRTVFIAPPEMSASIAPGTVFSRAQLGSLNPNLFLSPSSEYMYFDTLDSSFKQPIELKQMLPGHRGQVAPDSSMAKRTKQEIKSAQKMAKKHSESPHAWARCLVSYSYSLWFLHLPAYVKASQSKTKLLRLAFDILVKLQEWRVQPIDEVCYRVLMQLCGQYGQPVLAVRLLFEMKRHGMQPNAVTYGFYNKAVLESTWPSANTNGTVLWHKLRNYILAVGQFRSNVKSIKPSAETPKYDENNSTGGLSDVGYSSMTVIDGAGGKMGVGSDQDVKTVNRCLNFESLEVSALENGLHGSILNETADLLNMSDILVMDGGNMQSSQEMHERTMVEPEIGAHELPIDNQTEARVSSTLVPVTQNDPLGALNPLALAPIIGERHTGIVDSPSRTKLVFNAQEPLFKSDKESSLEASLDRTIVAEPVTNGSREEEAPSWLEMFKGNKLRSSGRKFLSAGAAKIGRSSTFVSGFSFTPGHKRQGSITSSDSLDDNNSLGSGNSNEGHNQDGFVKGDMKRSATLPPASPYHSNSASPRSSTTNLSTVLSPFSKKASESLFTGLRSMATKLTEIKEAISTTNSYTFTAVSGMPVPEIPYMPRPYYDDDYSEVSVDGRYYNNGTRIPTNSSRSTGDDSNSEESYDRWGKASSTSSSQQQLLSALKCLVYQQASTPDLSTVALEVVMTSCTRCHGCSSILFDEEIMAGWTSEESNLNTRCYACQTQFVSFLQIVIKDYRTDEESSVPTTDTTNNHPFSHPLQQSEVVDPLQTANRNNLSAPSTKEPNMNAVEFLFENDLSDNGSSNNSPKDGGDKTEDKCYIEFDSSGDKLRVEAPIVRGAKDDLSVKLTSLPSSATSSRMENWMAVVGGNGKGASRPRRETPFIMDTVTVPYLSPIILNKELESILESEGDSCLTTSEFVDSHAIVYWNLVWVFKRIGVQSLINGLCLNAHSVNQTEIPSSWLNATSANVWIRCMWDNSLYHSDISFPPIYTGWDANEKVPSKQSIYDQNSMTKPVLQQMVNYISLKDDVCTPLRVLITETRKRKQFAIANTGGAIIQTGEKQKQHYSLYRELLFLTIAAIGRSDIDLVAFDREYKKAYERLTVRQQQSLRKCDSLPSRGAVFCRQMFSELELDT